ncbi:TIGR01777 family oxidoreductase [Snuella sedimenti]|uniref:TIGR01777 family oxidoreductase n=1 Tax=Snuella sedimenti TaxID=2798802 RepID=A0A8J7LMY0_9FLAO|nr:TIGR01777 family oxidoreductase [Snuella sedimenti]MBJ6367198.1 TIGR01777 family oxidoreductase [Snuella sedimenti]
MRVLITGATGLIGQAIVKRCHKEGVAVNYLTTKRSKLEQRENYKGFYWNVKTQDIDAKCFKGVDAIIHLAGAAIAKRWTRAYKKVIISSRVQSTQLLINALKGESHTIKQVVSASAIGIYPDSRINYYDEKFTEFDTTFLSEVTKTWERAVDNFSSLNIPVSKIRIGLVLSNKGGALPEIVKPMRYWMGASFGSGNHWQSWIHIKDLARMFLYILEHQLFGVYNGVAPNPVNNHELTRTVARVLGKPLILPNIPKSVMQFILGEMHVLLFLSQRVSSKKIEDKGFYFKYHHLRPALKHLLK